ncbi:MAG: glycoside hydrolase family 88 protein, partial [Thermoanaerobaculia bacterium]
MKRTADWQLDHPKYEPRDWTNAVFYTGLLAAHRVVGETRYLEELMRVGEEQLWRPGRRERHADDHAIAQTYLDLYRIRRQGRMIGPFRELVDRMMTSPPRWKKAHQTIDYWWSDALFMSPPALAKLAAVTNEAKYLEFMDRLWREAHDLLYDPRERLFHRDARMIGGDAKAFWSRGNAWVLAGLVRVLDELPEDHPSRRFYLTVYGEMADRVAALQPADGLWRSDLLASPLSAPGESS